MKIRRYPIIVAIVWFIIEMVDIGLAVISFTKINFTDKSSLTINNPHLFNVVFFILMFFAVFQFYTVMGHYQLSRTGIVFQFLFYRKHYRWKDFRYIVKLKKQHSQKENQEDEDNYAVFLFSVALDKENIGSINSLKDRNGIFFRLPYSEKLEEMITANYPSYTHKTDTVSEEESIIQ